MLPFRKKIADARNVNILESGLDIVQSPSLHSEVLGVPLKNPPGKCEASGIVRSSITPTENGLSVTPVEFEVNIEPSHYGIVNQPFLTPTDTPSGLQNYLVEAAFHVAQAQKCEVEENFEAAFYFYNAAISSLSRGMEEEKDKIRRVIIREKIAQYQRKLENIYSIHLVPAKEIKPKKVFNWADELKNYKVIQILESVMLVLNLLDEKCYVIKVLQKSPCPVNEKKKTIIPFNVPYMVKLKNYFENECSIFLVLQYANGGKLWDCFSTSSTSTLPFDWADNNSVYSDSSSFSDYELINSVTDNTIDNTKDKYNSNNYSQSTNNFNYFELSKNQEIPSTGKIGIVEDFQTCINKNYPIINIIDETQRLNIEDIEVVSLLENSQKLLKSVNETLENSEKLAKNVSKELINIENAFDLNCGLVSEDGNDSKKYLQVKKKKRRSKSAILKPKLERSYSSMVGV